MVMPSLSVLLGMASQSDKIFIVAPSSLNAPSIDAAIGAALKGFGHVHHRCGVWAILRHGLFCQKGCKYSVCKDCFR